MALSRDDLEAYLKNFLKTEDFQDYGPNGLQVEGKTSISKLAFAVSATRDSILAAVQKKADALIVHHGLFWSFHGARPLVGPFYERTAPLIQQGVNLFAYHLPLDAHPEIGNAKSLADSLGLGQTRPFGDHKGMPTGVWGTFEAGQGIEELARTIERVCRHSVIVSNPEGRKTVGTMGIITGGANGDWVYAQRLNLESYLTGEISEHDWHEAREAGVTMYAAGHHATERFGIQALMDHLRDKFSLECFFIDSPNPA
ncbi:MAG: Nif3-like dinuclear metal center hexameric protein [Bacteriovoracales bacterium]|nr:Nif3-like dinuclear metal center hexameric protein [Bacteriovoracales bacterium]